jgi:3-carboxy-cis,cis-muconate cycloisomerase
MDGLSLTFADAAASQALSDERLLAAMAGFEAALARACARTSLIPAGDAEVIASVCKAARFDAGALAGAARKAGTLAIPFVKALTAQVAAASAQAARHVHFGATSQDVQDTALVLCLREASTRIEQLAVTLGDAADALARAHAETPCLARTLLQPALPVPFGWKAAVWLSLVGGSLRAFRASAKETYVLQFGGPAGTLSAYGAKSGAVEAALAEELRLAIPDVPWHSRRDGLARFGAAAAALAGAAGKVARDVSLLMQPEIGEASEATGAGRGGSSSLPHKRNPAQSMLALEAAQRTPGLVSTLLVQVAAEHERGLGQWQSQWMTLRDLLGATASALSAMGQALAGLEVDAAAMARNIERMRGLVYSEALSVRLAAAIGKQEAHHLTERLCARAVETGRHLVDVARADAQAMEAMDQAELAALFQPQRCFGAAPAMIERARAQWARVRG